MKEQIEIAVMDKERDISMLRQWLNEDRKCTPMVTNDEIKHWLLSTPLSSSE